MSFSFIEIDLIQFTLLRYIIQWFSIYSKLCDHHTTLSNSRIFSSHPNGTSPEKPVCTTGCNRTGHGTTDWFKIGKEVHQGYILSRCIFNFYTEYIMLNAWMVHKLESR